MVTTLKRALPAVAATAFLAFAPSALAATVTSGEPLTLNGDAAVSQSWTFSDSDPTAGTVVATLSADPVLYGGANPALPANCTDYDGGAAGTNTPGPDLTNDPDGDGTAYILRCTGVTSLVATAGDAGSSMDGQPLTETPITLTGGTGDDIFYGSEQNDVLNGGDGRDAVRGQLGDDIVNGGNGDDFVIAGGPGVDTLTGGDGNDYLKGGPDADTIDAGAGDDYVAGDCAGDCSAPQAGNDTIDGGEGNDAVYGEDGNDVINGGAGDDQVNWNACLGFGCNGGLHGGNGDDVINGGTGDDEVYGEDGNDQLDGNDGRDYVAGSYGDDVINGGAGDDGGNDQGVCSLASASCFGGLDGGPGDDTINGNDGNDNAYGGDGNDHIDGGAGNDGDVNVEFDNGIGAQASSFSAPGLWGGAGDDVVTGGPGDDVIGNDEGVDALSGGDGSDYFVEGLFGSSDTSADSIVGDSGVDTFQYWTCASGSDGDTFTTTLDGQANDGRNDSDTETADDTGNNYDVENVRVLDSLLFLGNCPKVNATLTGNDGANVLISGRGSDSITGGNGPDRLEGNGGDDTFNSRDGYPDYVECGEGVDTVTGDNFDTYEGCENVDSITMRSAYDLQDASSSPPAAPPILVPAADSKGPNTTLTTDTTITTDQLLKGVNLTVGCDEACTIEGRLLGNQLVGKSASTSAVRGFNVILGRKYMGLGTAKRKVTVKPCVRKSKKDAAACRTRLQNQWKPKRSFTVKVQVTTRDKAGNRTRKTKLVKVTNNHYKATR